MIDRILKGGSYFCGLFFIASFVVMHSGGCEVPSQKPDFTKEIVTITAPLIEEKTEEKIKEETSTEGETGSSNLTECVCTE